MPGIYPRMIEVRRITPAPSAVGITDYSGAAADPDGSQSETLLFSGIPASIQAKQSGRKKDGTLTQDAVFAPTWDIWIPLVSLAKGSVRDRDIIVDDEGYRYEVGQDYWNILGYKLVCIRLEA